MPAYLFASNFFKMTKRNVFFLLASLSTSAAFTVAPAIKTTSTTTTTLYNGASGGWGVGNSRDLTPEEFVRGDRKAFEGYDLVERGDFMRQVQADKESMLKSEMNELLGVAKIAGIDVKDTSERLNKISNEDLFMDDEEDLDLRVYDDDEVDMKYKQNVESITRMDEDTGASGVW